MYTLKQIEKALLDKGYLVYNKPYKLNIVGIRTDNKTSPTTFDDFIAYFYYDDKGMMVGRVAPATTDPSVTYLRNPLEEVRTLGTAILKSGQYIDAYKIGTHNGASASYTAIVQDKPVTVIRDNDRNDLLNFFADTHTGRYGINIHRASRNKNNTAIIGGDSAGCQVFKNESDFNEMMRLAEVSRMKYGNKFTYTLLDQMDTLKYKRNLALVGAGLGLLGLGAYLYLRFRNK